MLYNRHQAVGYNGHAYLDANRILSRAPELLDLEMLLHPLVEELDLPSVFIQVGDLKSCQVESVGKEGEVAVLFVVMVSDKPELFGILLKRRLLCQDDL